MKNLLLPSFTILSFWALVGCSSGAHHRQTAVAIPHTRQSFPNSSQSLRSKASGSTKEEIFRTPKELLLGINVWMRQLNLPELTREELIVRLADQQIYRDAPPRAEYLLETIVENRKFELPVELREEHQDDIALSEQYSSSKRLHLPSHYTLAIQVLNVPWNSSLDKYGNQMKVDFTNVIVAHAFTRSSR